MAQAITNSVSPRIHFFSLCVTLSELLQALQPIFDSLVIIQLSFLIKGVREVKNDVNWWGVFDGFLFAVTITHFSQLSTPEKKCHN